MNWLENANFVSGIVLPGIAIYGIHQIIILKKEIKAKDLRAIAEKAIKVCERYSASQKQNDLTLAYMKDGIDISYKGKIGDFTRQSLTIEDQLPQNKRYIKYDLLWMPLLNEYDVIASYFIFAVADEKLGFRLIGKSFCRNIESYYDIISQLRTDSKSDHFCSIIKLYDLWKLRISKDQMEEEIQSIKMKLKG